MSFRSDDLRSFGSASFSFGSNSALEPARSVPARSATARSRALPARICNPLWDLVEPMVPAAALGVALVLATAVPSAASLGGQWRAQGPGPAIDTDGVEGILDLPVTGAIEAVVAHPTNPAIVWIGAVNGGVFRTDNALAPNPTWIAQTDFQASLSIGALELDPTDASANTLVAGIGRTSAFDSDGGSLSGVLKTTNGGTNWTLLSSGLVGRSASGVAPRGSIIVVSIDKTDSQAITDAGVFRSTNGGASFAPVSGTGAGLPAGQALDLVGDPKSPTRLFTVIRNSDLPGNSGIFRSNDSGATWTKISNAAQDALINSPAADVDLAVGKSGPATPNVFAAICDTESLAGLFRTGDGATLNPSWQALDLPMTVEGNGPQGVHPGNQCGIHMSLVADPIDPNVVYIGGDTQPDNGTPSQFPNAIGAEMYVGRLFRVDAGEASGSQATPLTHCALATEACGFAVRTVHNSAPHADSREMVFDFNGDIIQVDDGGIYRHTDPSGSNGDWLSMIGTLTVTEQHDLAFDRISQVPFTGNQDNGTTLQLALENPTWPQVFGGDGGEVAVAENTPSGGSCVGTPPCSTRFWSVQNQIIGIRTVYDSTNTLQSEDEPFLDPLDGSPDPEARFITPLGVNSVDPTRMVIGAENGVFESFDGLDSVILISDELVNAKNSGNYFAYGAVGNPDALYYGVEDKVMVRTAAPPFAPASSDPDPGFDTISGVAIDPDDGRHAFAVDGDQVFRTANGGASWTDVTGNLLTTFGPGKLRSLIFVVSPTDRAIVVGTDRGAFAALDDEGFTIWQRLGTGIPNVPIYELDYDGSEDLLVAGTLGRGTWTLSNVLEAQTQFQLNVNKTGTGAGTVTSSPPGISCGGDCTESYSEGSVVRLNPQPAAGSVFAGWSGACTGTGVCDVTLSANRAVTARFDSTGGGGECQGAVCLRNERFEVDVSWRTAQGTTGSAVLVPGVRSDDSAVLYFFQVQNWELLIKVLDGCPINQHYWVYAAATTDVEYTLTVTDTVTTQSKSYFNPLGTASASITDSSALPVCDSGVASATEAVGTLGVVAARFEAAERLAAERLTAESRALLLTKEVSTPPSSPAVIGTSARGTANCVAGASTMCLNQGRFKVEVSWETALPTTGVGQVVPFATQDSGLFYFFEASNWEMLVKVLDGCAINSRFWVYAAATTDVGYQLVVTDTVTDEQKFYDNPVGRASPAITDTNAFSTCTP